MVRVYSWTARCRRRTSYRLCLVRNYMCYRIGQQHVAEKNGVERTMISERANRSDESRTGSEPMLPLAGNPSNSVARMLLAFCLFLPLNAGHTADGKAVRPSTTNLPAMNFAGEWKTREGTSPTISIVFSEERDRRHQVRINGKPIEMTGGRLPEPVVPAFFHFLNLNSKGPYGGISYKEIGLVNGMMNSKEVLSGFYSGRDHDFNDRIKRGFSVPVVLYPVKTSK